MNEPGTEHYGLYDGCGEVPQVEDLSPRAHASQVRMGSQSRHKEEGEDRLHGGPVRVE
jgi:hypothetical protein